MMRAVSSLLVSIVAFIIVVCGGAEAVLRVEQPVPTANIKTKSDALWWALNVSSVGDANTYPVTNSGRIIGAVLIVVGYALFTINTAIVVSVIKQREERVTNIRFKRRE